MSNKWPAEHLEVLRKLEGESAGAMLRQIKTLRPNATRSAVIGQCNRHGIRLSEKPQNRVKAGTRERIVQMRAPHEIAASVDPEAWAPLPGIAPIALMARSEFQCPWPIGETPDAPADLKCCGAAKDFAANYCPAHMQKRRALYQPPAINAERFAA